MRLESKVYHSEFNSISILYKYNKNINQEEISLFFFFFNYLFIYGCVGSSFLCEGFL